MIINITNENENNENDREKNNNNKWKWTDNNIGESGATAISESLKTNTTLTELNFWTVMKRCKIRYIHKDQFMQSYYVKNVLPFLSFLLYSFNHFIIKWNDNSENKRWEIKTTVTHKYRIILYHSLFSIHKKIQSMLN